MKKLLIPLALLALVMVLMPMREARADTVLQATLGVKFYHVLTFEARELDSYSYGEIGISISQDVCCKG